MANEKTPIKVFGSTKRAISYDTSDEQRVSDVVRREVLSLASTTYFSASVSIVRNAADAPTHLVVYLLRQDTYTAETVRIDIDGSYQARGVSYGYDASRDAVAYEQEVARDIAGEYSEYDFVAATPVPDIPTALQAVDAIAEMATGFGLKVKTLLGNEATVANYQKYLQSGLKGFVNVGHGNTTGIVLDDGMLSYTWFASLSGKPLSPAVVYFNSCQTFNSPLQPAIMSGGARTFVGGIVNLLIGPSEQVCTCFWSKCFGTDTAMGYALKKCETDNYPQAGAHGISGDVEIFTQALRQAVLAVTNFGYDAGGWRVEMHPRVLADLTGDKRADIVGFGNAGTFTCITS